MALGLAMLFSLYPAALAESNADAAESVAELTDALEFGTLPAPVEEPDEETASDNPSPEPDAVAETAVESEPQADGDASELFGEARSVADGATLQNAPDTDKETYVLMNIPYADFYKAELNQNAATVDAVTSATKMKPRTGGLAGGSYHVNSDGSDISGVIYPVRVSDMSLLDGKTQVTDDSVVSITATHRGQESTTE